MVFCCESLSSSTNKSTIEMKTKFVLIFLWFNYANAANILYISAIASPSHHIWNTILAKALVEKHHNVTVIGPEENIKNSKNYTYISLEGVYKIILQEFNLNEMSDASSSSPLIAMKIFDDWCISHCKTHLESKSLDVLLNYPPSFKFDLIIIDLTLGPCFLPLIHHFKYPPSVAVTAFLLPPYNSYSFGNDINPSYQPHYELLYDTEMSFQERFWNFLFSYIDLVMKQTRQFSYAHEYGRKVFGEDLPPLEKLERHVSILLSNTDPVLNYAQPMPPNIIPVGGLHTRKSKELPLDLQKLLDNAKNGVILFSLGSNIRSDKLDAKVQTALLEAFKQRPETFIWKFESDIQNLPENVIVRKWLPQNEILGHPNVKLFIGHGGALSTQEAIFHGVPIIAVPFLADQLMNSKIVVKKKIGLKMDASLITKEYVLNHLNEVLNNPLYNTNMKKLSKAFKDRTETPLERGLYWIEYVLRNGGAEFLSPPSRDMKFYQIFNLDVISLLVIIVSSALFILCKVLRKLVNLCSANKKVKLQ